MFSQTASVLNNDEIVPFQDATCIGNKALYLLVGSRVDGYFQRAIKQFEGRGDKALSLLKMQCAHINPLDNHYFHQLFTSLRIKENESATSYLQRFTYAQTEAEGASNVYTEHQLVDFALSGLSTTKNMKYETAIQLYNLEREGGKIFTLQDIEQKFFAIDKKSARDQTLTRLSYINTARGHQQKKVNGRGHIGHRAHSSHNGRTSTNGNNYKKQTNEHARQQHNMLQLWRARTYSPTLH
jgi:hypothetical protein